MYRIQVLFLRIFLDIRWSTLYWFCYVFPNLKDKSHSMHVNCLSKRKVAYRMPPQFIFGPRFNLIFNRIRWKILRIESSKGKFAGWRVKRWLSLFYFRRSKNVKLFTFINLVTFLLSFPLRERGNLLFVILKCFMSINGWMLFILTCFQT